MDDDLLRVIRNSRKPELKESSDLLKRIEVRDLYKCAGESVITKRIKSTVEQKGAETIAGLDKTGTLDASDLIIHCFSLDWGNKEKYPIDDILFFNSTEDLVVPDRVRSSHARPMNNSELRVRVLVRDGSK
jgi:hypothetical protein